MLITKPDFYDSFKCRAGECTDSCCIGWEIDIDDETMRKYENENGSLSVKLNRFTDRGEAMLYPDRRRSLPVSQKRRFV